MPKANCKEAFFNNEYYGPQLIKKNPKMLVRIHAYGMNRGIEWKMWNK
jgi:hypothetical protein